MTEPVADVTLPPVQARRATDLPPDAPWYVRWVAANVTEAWKWTSVQFPSFVGGFMLYYAGNQEQVHQWVQSNIPVKYWPWLGLLACVLQIIFRVTNLKGNKQ